MQRKIEEKVEYSYNVLSDEVQRYNFKFFNQQELGLVSKKFNEFSKQERVLLLEKYESNIFYTVGDPIQYSDNKRRRFVDVHLGVKYKKEISLKEIFNSFNNIKELKIFNNEFEAYEYSRFLRHGDLFYDGKESFQPAIFKVIYLGKLKEAHKQQESLSINPGCSSSSYDYSARTTLLEYFEVKRINVIPLEGTLKIYSRRKDRFKEYGTVDYTQLNFLHENERSLENECSLNSCVIS